LKQYEDSLSKSIEEELATTFKKGGKDDQSNIDLEDVMKEENNIEPEPRNEQDIHDHHGPTKSPSWGDN
jgi:hypothetical protein